MEKYICEIDGTEFTNKEDLILHFLNNFTKTLDTQETINGLSCESIYKKFKKSLPNFIDIKVKKGDKEEFIVDIVSEICNFSCKIETKDEIEWDYYYYQFSDLDKAIDFYKTYFDISNEIIDKVKYTHNIDLKISDLWEDAGQNEREINFIFQINNHEMTETYKFEGVNQFIDKFKQYTLNFLEGKMEIGRLYKIGGIPIDGLVKRSNKVRLEIIE